MLDHYDPWLELWSRLNSNSVKETGLALKYYELCNLEELDLDILFELDAAHGEVLQQKHKKAGSN